MKINLLKFPIIAIMALTIGIVTGCKNPEDQKDNPTGGTATFSVSFNEAGPGYVTLNVKASQKLEAAYTISTTKSTIKYPSVLFASGKKVNVNPEDEVLRISADIQETTTYYLHIAAKLSADSYSEITEIEFTTDEFEFTALATVVGVDYDGYKMNVTVPKSVKTGKSAIRYAQCDFMFYNYNRIYTNTDDYFSLLYNAGDYLTEDTVLEYSHETNIMYPDLDINEDGVIDENDVTSKWNPISPGEPVVFIAGEFEWMEIPEDFDPNQNYTVNGFPYPAGWDPGYYLPCLDSEKYWNYINGGRTKSMNIFDADVKKDIDSFWTGAFQRKIFHIQKPETMEAKVNIDAVDIGPVNATVILEPEEGVKQFAYLIADDATMNIMEELALGKEEYYQWAVTSFFGLYVLGCNAGSGYTEINLNEWFIDVPSDTDIHVLVTAMGNEEGTVQSFNKYTFRTTQKVMDAPEIEVTALPEESSPYLAAFNVKCTTFDDPSKGAVTKAYYGANYKKDFIHAVNSGSSYFSLAQSQAFSEEDIAQINSPEGLTIKIPSIDNETTRLAVVGYNKENTPNDFNFRDILECPAVDDCTTPWRDPKAKVNSELFKTLTGDWTATVTYLDNKTYSSKMSISNGITEGDHYPSALPESVYTTYSELAGWTKEETDSYFDEFKSRAEEYNENRLLYQNSLLIEGWPDRDDYERLYYTSPWDLFISETYSGVDVKSMFSDFGPKLYLEVSKDDQLSITADMNYMPPVSYVTIPYYMAGYNTARTASEGNIVFYHEDYAPLNFPVELSEDGNTLTIKRIVDLNGEEWYPNLIGIDPMMGYQISYPIVSDIVLTRGWDETKAAANVKTKAAAPAKIDTRNSVMPDFTYKSITRFAKPKPVTKVEGKITTADDVHSRMGKIIERLENRNENK